jgi:transposase InsO family protein
VSGVGVRVGVGTRFAYDGEVVEVVEMLSAEAGNAVVLASGGGKHVRRVAVRELLASDRARVIPDRPGPSADDPGDIPGVVLAGLTEHERHHLIDRAAHVREALTGHRSGSPELASDGEPRPEFAPDLPLETRYVSKAAELGVSVRTFKRWVQGFRQRGEAGLAVAKASSGGGRLGRVDERWVQTALEVMVEHTGQSTPSRSMVIDRTGTRLAARYGPDVVRLPSRATAYRALEELERRHPTFRLSSKRNQDIAARPGQPYGKLRPTRPGEYLLMDTTRLDVFGMDPLTLRWVQVELTVAMDWYTRCITGIRLTPVSTKSVDAAATLYQAYRPPPAGPGWPAQAVWPEHGIPRAVLLDAQAVDGPLRGAAGPALVPETIVVDHGKIYVSEHLTSVCQRLGISIQPARLRTGRDKGPVERFFRTLREDLLQALPGYKGPDVYSRGERPEAEAFFFLDELDAVLREWVGVVYHHRPHASLLDPHLPGLRMSPAVMFEHGMARAGWIEVPRDPDLAFEFLPTCWRTIQHYGVEVGGRRYNGPALDAYRDCASPHGGPAKGRWPIQVNPDDITKVYFRDPAERRWHALEWEHAASLAMPLSDEALRFARQMAATRYTYPDDKLAVADLLARWNLSLDRSPAERRMALRLSREQAAVELPGCEPPVASLPSVRKALEPAPAAGSVDEPVAETGDDDAEDLLALADEEDFYAEAWEDV